ncbi:MAG: dipeptide epimerase [Fimbriimonadaceae bacterium]|nr:dipeptide epimerase [Fimbriimonadaceae bacterium]
MVAHQAPCVFLQLRWTDGLESWGEAAPLHSINGETGRTCFAALQDLAEWLVNQEAQPCLALLGRLMPFQHAAVSAFEMAVQDYLSQAAGLPLWRFLGPGDPDKALRTDQTISILPPPQAAEEAARIVHEGFTIIKVKLGDGVRADLARLEAIRIAVGEEVTLRVDANQAYDAIEGETLLRGLEPFGIEFIEQPVAKTDLAGMKALNDLGLVPVMADESCFSVLDGLALRGCCWGVNVKLSKSRGLAGGLAIAQLGYPSMVGGMIETRLGTTAAAHLARAHPSFQYFDLDSSLGHGADWVIGGISVRDGVVHLPDSPGLGASLDSGFLSHVAGSQVVEVRGG